MPIAMRRSFGVYEHGHSSLGRSFEYNSTFSVIRASPQAKDCSRVELCEGSGLRRLNTGVVGFRGSIDRRRAPAFMVIRLVFV